MKVIDVTYNGIKEKVEINDDASIGTLEKVMKKNVPTDAIKLDVKQNGEVDVHLDMSRIDIVGYRHDMTVACVEKAPWQLDQFDNVPMSTAQKVVEEVMACYPPFDFLASFVQSMIGGEVKGKKSRK